MGMNSYNNIIIGCTCSYLRDNLKMVDGARVGVWGRGYGGGAAAALAADDVRNVTRCVAAVAPLTDLTHHSESSLLF